MQSLRMAERRPESASQVAASGRRNSSTDFERERVADSQTKGNLSFLSIFAGRHTAAPELVIGPQFVMGGASASSMFVGLFIGNILAVLSWRFWCAPVAVRQRFTTYYQVERICGKRVLIPYNIIVGSTLAAIAGAMFSIAGTAMGTPFGLVGPTEHDWVAPNLTYAVAVVLTGLVTTAVATFGLEVITAFSNYGTPLMFAILGFMVWRSFALLGLSSPLEIYDVADASVFKQEVSGGRPKLHLGSVICTAWFQDQFVHLGMVDLTLFRYAKAAGSGWMSAFGMYPGHYVLWIAAGFLYAADVKDGGDSANFLPGPIAFKLAGYPGLLAILFAGWSTANPFLYAGGLAFQSALNAAGVEKVNTRYVTMAIGALAIMASLIPPVITSFMPMIGLAGAVIGPMGAIIFADLIILPRMCLVSEYSWRMCDDGSVTNWAAACAWSVSLAAGLFLQLGGLLEWYFVPFIGYPTALFLYVALSKIFRGETICSVAGRSIEMVGTGPP